MTPEPPSPSPGPSPFRPEPGPVPAPPHHADFRLALDADLAALQGAHLFRALRRIDSLGGVRISTAEGEFLNFSSNDYLGLALHPELARAAQLATERYGSGATASRLVCGSLGPHHDLEAELARFKGTEAALAFSSGYATALGTLPALVGPGDVVILDRLAHACLVDAARLSRAKLRVFRHNDPEDLRRLLRWANARRDAGPVGDAPSRILVATESVFSMDGDRAPLRELVEVTAAEDAWLLVDEAHATGLIGPGRRGLIEELGIQGRVEVQMGTLGKALGASGGFIAGIQPLRDLLVNRARSFLFSTAPPPGAAAAACAAVRLVASPQGAALAATFWARVARLHAGLRRQGWTLPELGSGILPLRVGSEEAALRLATALRAEGFLVPAIRYPTVARGQARLRVTVSAAHAEADLDALLEGLRRAMDRTGIRPMTGNQPA